MSNPFEDTILADGHQNDNLLFEVKCAELTPLDPNNIVSGITEEKYRVKVLWVEERETGSIQVAFDKNIGLFECLQLLVEIEEKISQSWLLEFVHEETLNCLIKPIKNLLITQKPEPNSDPKKGRLGDWLQNMAAKPERRTSELIIFSIWMFSAIACGNLSRSDPIVDQFYQLISGEFWAARNWLDNDFANHMNEIRNLHLYDKIDSTSQAAGESAIGQTVSPQTAIDLVLPEDISLEEMIKIIEKIKGTIIIENLNIIIAE
jgi:hypothetical protein